MASSCTSSEETPMGASTNRSLTVIAWGNESRGDDGAGPLLARRLDGLSDPGIEVIEDFQLQVEHVMDLHSDVPVLFVDASVEIDDGYRLDRLRPAIDGSITTHNVSPNALLGLFEQTLGEPAPEAYLLHICGAAFELGTGLSESAKQNADAAWEFLEELLGSPRTTWVARLQAAAQH